MLNKIYYIVGTIPKSIIRTNVVTETKSHIHDRSLYWLDTDTSIKSGGIKLVV
jgi:hypothetical protein